MSFLLKNRTVFKSIAISLVNKPFIIERNFSKIVVCRPSLGKQLLTPVYSNVQTSRWKGGKGIRSRPKQEQVSEEESEPEEHDFDDLLVDKTTKIKTFKTGTLRSDGLLKTGLGVARNKVDEAFFESKIRVNGKKILKKSEPVKEGDELDIIKGFSITNPKLINVARVEILSVQAKGDHFQVKTRGSKSIVIENYQEDPWISPAMSTES